MKISIICTSHRENSESSRVSFLLKKKLKLISKSLDLYLIDLQKLNFPLWNIKKKNNEAEWENWLTISKMLEKSDGFILVIPEYGGMAAPNAKNFFLLCGNGELAHKPGLIVSISSGSGGSYPISEIRSSSYKNTHINWIPENIIIRNVESYNPGSHGKNIPSWMDQRIDYALKMFLLYSKHLKPVRKHVNRKDFANGM